MSTKIWLEELSFGSNFGNLCSIGSNRFWCYFLVHTFKIKSISSNGSRDITKLLKISFGSSFVSLRAFVLVYITFAHGRTDGRTDIFRKSFLFFSWSTIYIHVYTYLDYFSNFTPILTKVIIPFFLWNWVWKFFFKWSPINLFFLEIFKVQEKWAQNDLKQVPLSDLKGYFPRNVDRFWDIFKEIWAQNDLSKKKVNSFIRFQNNITFLGMLIVFEIWPNMIFQRNTPF